MLDAPVLVLMGVNTISMLTAPQADSLTEEQVSEFREAFSLFVSPAATYARSAADSARRTRTVMVRPPSPEAPTRFRGHSFY